MVFVQKATLQAAFLKDTNVSSGYKKNSYYSNNNFFIAQAFHGTIRHIFLSHKIACYNLLYIRIRSLSRITNKLFLLIPYSVPKASLIDSCNFRSVGSRDETLTINPPILNVEFVSRPLDVQGYVYYPW